MFIVFMTAKRQPLEVEIIPTFHEVDSLAFTEVLEHIKRIPKNSFLFMEITEKELNEGLSVLRKIDYATVKKYGGWLHRFNIFIEAQKRNLRILPIESLPFVRAEVKNWSQPKIDLGRIVYLHNLREEQFARNIEGQGTQRLKNYVVLGAQHALSLKQILGVHGVKADVNMSFYSGRNREEIKNCMEVEIEFRSAVLKGNYEAAKRLLQKTEDFARKIFQRRDKVGKGPISIVDRVKKSKEIQAERVKRNHPKKAHLLPK